MAESTPAADSPKDTRWWRQHGRTFAIATAAAAAVVVAVGLLTGIRGSMYAVLLTLAAFAFLPFIVIAILLALLLIAALISAGVAGADFGGDIGGDVHGDHVEGPLLLVPAYYRLLARIRHPVAWAIPAGGLLGVLGLWAVLGITVIPKEIETRERLVAEQEAVEAAHERDEEFPEPAGGELPPSLGVHVTDGFGQPLRYEVSGHWKFQRYEIRSVGLDGEVSGDDLCVEGGSKVVELAQAAVSIALRHALDDVASIADDLESLTALRCDAGD